MQISGFDIVSPLNTTLVRQNHRMPGPRTGDITPAQRQQLHRYLDEIERWRPRLNLTTVARHEAWQRHVDESRRLLAVAAPVPEASLIDVGSGAGVPGVVLALLRPDLRITLLEASRRKAGFLVHVCGLLGLERVTVDQRRAEEAARDPRTRDAFDLAVSRAAAPPAELCTLALPLVRPGGELWAMVADAAAAVTACDSLPPALRAGPAAAAAPGLLRVGKLSRGEPDRHPDARGAVPAPPRHARPRGPLPPPR
jgi:16S rRNA (guanine(527)-N(7))-methyltransferase RsmG